MGDILFLAHRVPFPPNRGDKIRAHHLLRRLAQLRRVHVGCFAESDEDFAGEPDLQRIAASHAIVVRKKPLVWAGVEAVLSGQPVSLTAFHSPRLEAWVERTLERHSIETIVIFSGQMGQYVPDHYKGRVVIDLCDVDSAKFQCYANAGERVWLNSREAKLLAREEERLGRRADATILITEAEAELYRSRLKSPRKVSIHSVGNGIDARNFDPAKVAPHPDLLSRKGPHFVFTGQMDYRPNEQAAEWVIENVLPEFRTRWPDAEFHVVGRNPTDRLKARKGTHGLTVWGEVPDVKPFLAAADCVLAPLLIARGVQNKVLEAMAMARPVMLTPDAAMGITAQDGRDWLMCPADAEAMRNRIEPILADRSLAHALGEAARQFVLDHHDWSAMLQPLDALVLGAGENQRDAA